MAGLEELYENTIGKVDTAEERNALLGQFDDTMEYYTPPALRKHVEALGAILPEIVSSADHKEMIEASGDISEDVTSGGMNMDTVNRILDLTGASAAALIPFLGYRHVKNTTNTAADEIMEALGPKPKSLRERSETLDFMLNSIEERINLFSPSGIKEAFLGPDYLRNKGPIGKVKQGTGIGDPDTGTFLGYDKHKLGTGEGSHVYSYGHYFGKLDQVVDFYRANNVLRKAAMAFRNGDTFLAENAFEKVGDKDFVTAWLDHMKKAKNRKEEGRLHREFMDKHADKVKEGYGAIKTPFLTALEERTASWDYPISQQSEYIQEGFRKTFEDLNIIFDDLIKLFPENQQEINKFRMMMRYPTPKEVPLKETLSRGMQGIFSNPVGSIFKSWDDATKFLNDTKDYDIEWIKALKDAGFGQGFVEGLLSKNGIHGMKYEPGQRMGGNTIKKADKKQLNYVMYNDNLIDDGTYTTQKEFDFGEQ